MGFNNFRVDGAIVAVDRGFKIFNPRLNSAKQQQSFQIFVTNFSFRPPPACCRIAVEPERSAGHSTFHAAFIPRAQP